MSTDIEAAKAARDRTRVVTPVADRSRPSAEAIEKAKQQALKIAKRYQAERSKALESARDRGKEGGLEVTRTLPTGPKRGPGDGHGL